MQKEALHMERLIDIPYKKLDKTITGLSDAGFDERLAGLARKPEVAKIMVKGLNDLFIFTEDEAIEILGRWNVLTIQDGWSAFNIPPSSASGVIRYLRKTFQDCAAANKAGLARWRLLYTHQISLMHLWAIAGTDLRVRYSFSPANDWWHHSDYLTFAMMQPAPGYYLVDFMPTFVHDRWSTQEKRIDKLIKHSRSHEIIVAQGLIGFSRVHDERLLEDRSHWGKIFLDSATRRLTVGVTDGGVEIGRHHPQHGRKGLGVCLTRQFDF
jgi:hypothetical protein